MSKAITPAMSLRALAMAASRLDQCPLPPDVPQGTGGFLGKGLSPLAPEAGFGLTWPQHKPLRRFALFPYISPLGGMGGV